MRFVQWDLEKNTNLYILNIEIDFGPKIKINITTTTYFKGFIGAADKDDTNINLMCMNPVTISLNIDHRNSAKFCIGAWWIVILRAERGAI